MRKYLQIFLLAGFAVGTSGPAHAYTQGKLMSGEAIGLGQAISYSSQYAGSGGGHLVLQAGDQNLVLYINNFNGSGGNAVYSPQTENLGGIIATMEASGDFTIRDGWTTLKWHTNTGNYPGAHLEIRDDQYYNGSYTADLVVVSASGTVVWRASANDPSHYYGGNINRPACTGAYCPGNLGDWTAILHSDGYGHDRPGYDLAGSPVHVYTELMCKNLCLAKNNYSSGGTYTGPCVAWAYDSPSGNCWLKGVTCDYYACYAPPVTTSSTGETSGMIDPSGWGIIH